MYFVANWKMYLNTDESVKLARFIKRAVVPPQVTFVACPSFVAAESVYKKLPEQVGRGAQDGFWVEKGAYTGAVSMAMLKDMGCTHVIVGHSERRHQFGETNEQVAKKMRTAWDVGLVPILCVGETAEERAHGMRNAVLKEQIGSVFSAVGKGHKECFLAYEPVWAISHGIGTKESCGPAEVTEVVGHVKEWLEACATPSRIHLLYGGSVEPKNIKSFLVVPGVEGVLVGAASADKKMLRNFFKVLS